MSLRQKSFIPLLIAAFCALSLLPAPAAAFTNFQLNAVNEDRPHYDPNESECNISGDSINISGNNVRDAFNYFTGVGLKDYMAAAIIGNLMQESGAGLDPKAQQDGSNSPYPKNGVGFGIAQWTYSDRQDGLVELAGKRNKPATDLGVQLEYVWQELRTTHKSALAALQKATTVDAATAAFAKLYEACALCSGVTDPNNREYVRIENARAVLKLAQEKGWTTGSGGGSGSYGCTAGGGGSASGNKIVQIALEEVGTSEGSSDNGGATCKYQGTGCPEAWCADFVSWVYKQAGVPFTGGSDGGWRIAGAAATGEWFKKNGLWISNPGSPVPVSDPRAPKPGDVVLYPPTSANAGGSGHVNIVVSYDGKTVKTVGGNQSDAVTTTPYDVFGEAVGWGRLR